MGDVSNRRIERADKKVEPDHDDEEEEKIEEEDIKDEEVLSGIGDILGRFINFSKETLMPILEFFLSNILELLKSARPSDAQTALCIFDDLVEFGLPNSAPYLSHFIPMAINSIQSNDPSLRQAAVYGMGAMAEKFSHEQFNPFAGDILNRLVAVITGVDAKTEDFLNSTENAICAVGKLCRYQPGSIDISKVLPLWLSWLPVTNDNAESPFTYNLLCDFVESLNGDLLGPGYQNLPKILSIFGDILGTELIDENITNRIIQLLKKFPPELIHKSWNSLSQGHQQKLQSALAM